MVIVSFCYYYIVHSSGHLSPKYYISTEPCDQNRGGGQGTDGTLREVHPEVTGQSGETEGGPEDK